MILDYPPSQGGMSKKKKSRSYPILLYGTLFLLRECQHPLLAPQKYLPNVGRVPMGGVLAYPAQKQAFCLKAELASCPGLRLRVPRGGPGPPRVSGPSDGAATSLSRGRRSQQHLICGRGGG